MFTRGPTTRGVALCCLFALTLTADAIILFGLDNSANQTDPLTGVPFDAVAKVYNTSDGATRGSAIYLGSGYMLTANHVAATVGQKFTFNGIDSYSLDEGFAPQQVASGVDLKVFRLTTIPPVTTVSLGSGGVSFGSSATMVGWGRGRDPAVDENTATVAWGNLTTVAKRWGLNAPRDQVSISYPGYSFTALRTVLGTTSGSPPGLGDSEAALTQYDSGSGMFQYLGGSWQLIGVAVTVEMGELSFFGNDVVTGVGEGHENYFANIGTYRSNILALIPEPSNALFLVSALAMALRRRRADG
jgi:hypothetical protein